MLWCLYATMQVVSGGEKVVGSIPLPLTTRHGASRGKICGSSVVSDLLESDYVYFDTFYKLICSVCVCVCERLHYMWCNGNAEISAGEDHVTCIGTKNDCAEIIMSQKFVIMF